MGKTSYQTEYKKNMIDEQKQRDYQKNIEKA